MLSAGARVGGLRRRTAFPRSATGGRSRRPLMRCCTRVLQTAGAARGHDDHRHRPDDRLGDHSSVQPAGRRGCRQVGRQADRHAGFGRPHCERGTRVAAQQRVGAGRRGVASRASRTRHDFSSSRPTRRSQWERHPARCSLPQGLPSLWRAASASRWGPRLATAIWAAGGYSVGGMRAAVAAAAVPTALAAIATAVVSRRSGHAGIHGADTKWTSGPDIHARRNTLPASDSALIDMPVPSSGTKVVPHECRRGSVPLLAASRRRTGPCLSNRSPASRKWAL